MVLKIDVFLRETYLMHYFSFTVLHMQSFTAAVGEHADRSTESGRDFIYDFQRGGRVQSDLDSPTPLHRQLSALLSVPCRAGNLSDTHSS